MNLLVVTQSLNLDDPVLSVYHGLVESLAHECERVEAICLLEGRHQLPNTVRVHSLRKENGKRSRIGYAFSFLLLAWRLRASYDAVFVHMNQEYVLIAGPLWKLLGKNVYLWRNHYAGSWATDLAAFWCTRVFCTSKRSYTAKYKKTELMPVGVNVDRFTQKTYISRAPRSLLFFSRITPSKRVELFIDALALVKEKGITFTATIVGSAPAEFEEYDSMLRERVQNQGLSEHVSFAPGVSNEKASDVFHASEIYVNCSPSGMLDKVIFEAAASGCLVLSESEDMRTFGFGELTYQEGSAESLAHHIEQLLLLPADAKTSLQGRLATLADAHSLRGLAKTLVARMQGDR